MLRISGVVLPDKKRMEIALTAIKGIGRSLSGTILKELSIGFDVRPTDLSEEQAARLRSRVEKELTEGELSRKVSTDVKRLQDIGTWRGYRHKKKLPVRGQTSRRNARTKRGKKKTGLSGRVTLTKT
ncbi:30S ribosomal protein S13 [Candidatus Peribacteria bacterium RIFCSPHIGHO2_01_FULL_55_13]|nr:MAG: 30S ribosomal protein S13 [Candidatus Peribacteria bacterium RIFCSPHIGHO2_01_FULL_55_13]OGJ64264.1 MAG: 30S ribosomal protein S13 [Candidatus Peribacteria bacterium RIFCSPHIGHO2_12_FULL_55_11]